MAANDPPVRPATPYDPVPAPTVVPEEDNGGSAPPEPPPRPPAR